MVRIYKFVQIYQFHHLIQFQTIILPNSEQYLRDRGLPSTPEAAASSLGRKTESMGKKAQQKMCCSCSTEAPGTWQMARAVPIVNTERSAERDLAKLDQRRAGNKMPRARPRLASQESGTTLTLPPPRPNSDRPSHRRYLGGGINMENTVQMHCGCKEPMNKYFMFGC